VESEIISSNNFLIKIMLGSEERNCTVFFFGIRPSKLYNESKCFEDNHFGESNIPTEVTKSRLFVESEASLPYLQQRAMGLNPESVESSAHL
jgi:hypothetical protein